MLQLQRIHRGIEAPTDVHGVLCVAFLPWGFRSLGSLWVGPKIVCLGLHRGPSVYAYGYHSNKRWSSAVLAKRSGMTQNVTQPRVRSPIL